jgi:stage V sporulation protein D (sporulation-specific penicillin-binding protein)
MKIFARHRKKAVILTGLVFIVLITLIGRLSVIMIFESEYYLNRAQDLHERERNIKASRGNILDTNGVVLAANKTVCTISVIHSQIEDKERVTEVLADELGLERNDVLKRVEKVTSIEKIASNVDKETGDRIRGYELEGVKVDEDYKRYYPFSTLASKVLGFTGSDNQGIVGLEAKYDTYLSGNNGQILTLTDAWGIEIQGAEENRNEPEPGKNLYISIDYNIQKYAQQLAERTKEEKQAKSVSVIVMNPQNGELMAMVNAPEYDLNNPYQLNYNLTDTQLSMPKMDLLNNMWRNFCINDTYEPGSIFKMVTATAALETGAASLSDSFTCGGYAIVADRRIRCHKTTGHGTQTFTQTVMNSCNPAFIEWGRRVGVDNFYKYMGKLGLLEKTGIDIAGEASAIVHKQENVGEVELATMSFGQSFQITPMQMLRAAAAIVNGGKLVTPHFGVKLSDYLGNTVQEFAYDTQYSAILNQTSDTMRDILRQVVEEGGGKKAYIEGFSIGGKTATSQKLPRGSGKYIASFIGFAPADNPKVIAMCIIDEPQGVYYGGTIAAPVIKELYENILPYLEISSDKE